MDSVICRVMKINNYFQHSRIELQGVLSTSQPNKALGINWKSTKELCDCIMISDDIHVNRIDYLIMIIAGRTALSASLPSTDSADESYFQCITEVLLAN